MEMDRDAAVITKKTVFLIALTLVFAFAVAHATTGRAIAHPSPELFEIRFLEATIDHHAMAVEMATLCEQQAARSELKTLCRTISSTQSQEIEEMQAWLQSWYEITYEPRMNDADERMINELERLKGADFDTAFMLEMSTHHRTAIRMASDALLLAFHEDLLELATDITATQGEEIRQMREWLCDFYEVCKDLDVELTDIS
ncbi:MAG: DUF305 domain-containing protein [Alphaproteobacteria bacterium]|uniref:DUF305 domain-containing protein n=1 Tax=Candidatus Nitrobium versatile TaxID=2884831 RepID=A0A953JCJ7_9BACT|nr:DUF305 domain-containing protein [Candidatus Nitrobium versatile]